MSQKHRNRRFRNALRLELLEDRTLLSGNVVALQQANNGLLFIQGDNGNNAFTVTQTTNLGFPTLTVTGSSLGNPLVPGNVTAINAVAGGSQNFALSSVTGIKIVEGNGTNFISLSNFNLPGNISITVGTGVDTISLAGISTNAGSITITGLGASKDNISENSVVAGLNSITTGSRDATIVQNNVTKGFDFITAGNGNNNITITNSTFAPPPRLYAIGQLRLTAGNGNNTVLIDNISVGPATVTLGNGNNNFKFDDSTIQQATITIGTESVGAKGSNTVDISNDTITGAFLNVNILNESGVSGKLLSGANGTSPGSVNTLTMNNVQFTNGGNLNVRVDDGVNYFNAGNNTVLGASTVLMELIDTGGNVTVTVGDFFQSVMLGVGTVGLNDIDANNLTVSIGQGNDIIVITAELQGSENVTIGNVSTIPTPPLPTPSVLINGVVGINHANEAGNETITLGTNANGKLTSGWPVNISQIVHGSVTITGGDVIALTISDSAIDGNLTITGGNAWALVVNNTTVGGVITVTLGNGGVNNLETINFNTVSANDIHITIATQASDMPDTVPAGALINLTNVQVNDTTPNPDNLSIIDNGVGVDIVTLNTVNVVYGMLIELAGWDGATDSEGNTAPGANVLTAENVTAAFGMIDMGGAAGAAGAVYEDLGGNYGYVVVNSVSSIP